MEKLGNNENQCKMSLEKRIKISMSLTKNRPLSKYCLFMLKQQKLNEIKGSNPNTQTPT